MSDVGPGPVKCPFCENENAELIEAWSVNFSATGPCVECPDCGMRGPVADPRSDDPEKDALEWWAALRFIEKPETVVSAWNAQHPIGQPVRVIPDCGLPYKTRTRSAAYLLDELYPAIFLAGVSHCVLLDRVTPISVKELQNVKA